MIEANLTELEKEAKEYIDMLTDNKAQELRKEMIKFLKKCHWPDSLEYGLVLEFINDFFIKNQPDYSQLEDACLLCKI